MQQEQFIHIDKNGNKVYFKDKEMKLRHRQDGPAIECLDGHKSWYANGKRHRLDGPSTEWPDGGKEWWVDGKRHRLDGPAVEETNGYKARYYVNGKCITEETFIALTSPKRVLDSPKPVLELTLDQIAEKFGITVAQAQLKIVK
jgi:hypothetical protein